MTQVHVSVVIVDRTAYVYSNGETGMNQLTSLSANGGTATTLVYDASGNLRSRKSSSRLCLAWRPDGPLSSVTSVTMSSPSCDNPTSPQPVNAYVYDGLGRRVKVEGSTSTTWTVSIYGGMDPIFEKTDTGSITRYVYANGMRIAKITSTGAIRYGVCNSN